MRYQFTRRQFLQLAATAGTLATVGLTGCTRQISETQAVLLEQMVIKGPQAPPSILLAHVSRQERLNALVPEVQFDTWANPDQLRAEVTSNALHVTATPTNVAANLYRRGVPVRLLNVTVWGMLYVCAVDASITTWNDLQGARIVIPFRGDMPDLIFRYLARAHGLDVDRDLTPLYVSAPIEALQLLLAGQTQVAVLGEPGATAAQLGAPLLGLQEPVIAQSLPRMQLEMVPAAAARDDLEFFFSRLKELSPDVIGGDLPDDAFYAA